MTTLNKTTRQEQIWLYFILRTTQPGYVGTTMSLQIVLNTQKNPYLNQATQKKYWPNFATQKNPRIKNFNPPAQKMQKRNPEYTPPPTGTTYSGQSLVKKLLHFSINKQTFLLEHEKILQTFC